MPVQPNQAMDPSPKIIPTSERPGISVMSPAAALTMPSTLSPVGRRLVPQAARLTSRIHIPPTSSLPPPRPLVTVSTLDQSASAASGSVSSRSATAVMPMLEIMPVANIRPAQM